jgi:histidinol-phosphate aminotransferase
VTLPWAKRLRPSLAGLSAYDVPRASARARMHANENPEPWPDAVMRELADIVRRVELGRYPDTSGRELREVIAARYGCELRRIVLGNGSDEVISTLLTALSGDARPVLVVPTPSFVMYGHAARVLDYEVREVELDEALQLDEPAMDAALAGATICFLARPNNPTGSLWDRGAIDRLVDRHPSVVFVIDEAYIAYAPGQSLWRADVRDNVVFMGTLSKVGLAALRVGYAIAHPVLAGALDKVRHPYNVSQTSIAIAQAVLTRFADVQQAMIDRAIASRERLAALFSRIPGAHVFPSSANLVLVRLPDAARARALVEHLGAHDVLVKDVGHLPRLQACVRASVGTAAELDHVEEVLLGWIRAT